MATTVSGSCLRGSVRYAVTGETRRLYHGHCQRCRTQTGSAHAINLLMKLIGIPGLSWAGIWSESRLIEVRIYTTAVP